MTTSWHQAPRRFVFSPAQWRRSLRRLARDLSSPEQEQCRQAATDLDAAYAPLREVFARLCPLACPDCERPCCAWVDVKGLMDQADLILFAGLGLDHLPAPELTERGCAFLGQAGCRLPWNARPFACLHHVCPRLRQVMGPGEAETVRLALERAAHLRGELVRAFLDGRGGEPAA